MRWTNYLVKPLKFRKILRYPYEPQMKKTARAEHSCNRTSMAVMNFYRISMSIRGLANMFSPEKIIFFDFRYDVDHLNFYLHRQLVTNIASDHGLEFTDLSQNKLSAVPDTISVYRLRSTSVVRERIAKFYAATIEVLTRVRCYFAKTAPRILILINMNIAKLWLMPMRVKI